MMRIELILQSGFEARKPGNWGELVTTFNHLCNELCDACIKAYEIMQKEYGETYFVPLMVTGMALVSRLHACAQTIQKEIPSCRTKLQI